MLKGSQPLDPKVYKKLGLDDNDQHEKMTERNIKSQHIGKLFDDLLDGSEKHKISLKKRLGWKWRDIKGKFYDIKYAFRNYFKWRKTMKVSPTQGSGYLVRCPTSLLNCHDVSARKFYPDFAHNSLS